MQNTPEITLAELLPFLSHSYRIYEAAVPEATFDEYTSKGEEEIDGWHHSSCVRVRVLRVLRVKPQGLAYDLIRVANNGIEVHHRGHEIKFYKGVHGNPPACGDSEARKAFYQQSLLGAEEEQFQAERLIVIVNIAKDGTFLGLDLACPKGVVSDYAPPELYWSIPIPHPATTQSSQVKYDEKPDELEDIRRDEDEGDLDISRDGTDDKE